MRAISKIAPPLRPRAVAAPSIHETKIRDLKIADIHVLQRQGVIGIQRDDGVRPDLGGMQEHGGEAELDDVVGCALRREIGDDITRHIEQTAETAQRLIGSV